MKKNYFETILGAFVLVLTILTIVYTKREMNGNDFASYTLTAKFDKANGIKKGSEVLISGLKVGEVIETTVDQKSFLAVIKFNISKTIKLPSDSSVMIATNGFFGNKHLAITPGGSDDLLVDGNEIIYTQGVINLESIIGKLLFNSGKKSK